MVEGGPAPWVIWTLIVVLGLGTFGFRLSFIQLQALIDGLPPRLEVAVTFVPPAILAALVFPELFVVREGVVGMFIDARVVAGGLAFAVAWRTKSMMATIGVGMVTLWVVQFVIG